MGETWYYLRAGQRQGPVDTAALAHLIRAGTVGGADLVWTDGMAEWQPAGTVGAFTEAAAARPAPAPPPVPPSIPPTAAGPTAGQSARAMLSALGDRAKVAGRAAGERAKAAGQVAAKRIKEADAAVPAPIKVGSRRVPKMAAYAAAGVAVLLVLLVGWMAVGGPPSVTAAKPQERYGDLNRDAAGPYDDAWIIVTGQVGSTRDLGPSLGDKTDVELQTDSSRNIVVCYFQGRRCNGTTLNQLSRADTISLRGKCMGNNGSGNVGVDNCELTSAPSSASD